LFHGIQPEELAQHGLGFFRQPGKVFGQRNAAGFGYASQWQAPHPRRVPIAAPATTSLRKCIPSSTRDAPMLIAQKIKPMAISGKYAITGMLAAKAVMVWPEGKLN